MDVAIVGGGFTGLAAALELGGRGCKVTVFEQDEQVGGLAGSFVVGGRRLEKFYHHWFTSDVFIRDLARRLGREQDILPRETRTGMYYAQRFFRLSSPLDVIRFTPLAFHDRIRLGLTAIAARRISDWRSLESLTAREWLLKICGPVVYRVVWEPLLVGKFGEHASEVSAVWFWNKLKLRGGSRSKEGKEQLAYYRGGFAALLDQMVERIVEQGGRVQLNTRVTGLAVEDGQLTGVSTAQGTLPVSAAVLTTPLPIAADLLAPAVDPQYAASLRRVRYLSNVAVVLELHRSLSSTYWLNVNDPSFPFVGIIEHTNFEPRETYGGRHVVYLSKYLSRQAELYQMSSEQVVDFSVGALTRMFPQFDRSWIADAHVWRADYSQPIIERHYSRLVPPAETPVRGVFLATMAQIYPEDRGTNYAVRSGFEIAGRADKYLQQAGRKATVVVAGPGQS
jgi:protoporphyrinogen oxidase